MRLVDLDTKVTTWHYYFEKEEYVEVQTTVGEMIDLNTHEGLSIPIIEIKEPHGRLGDLDALMGRIEHDTPLSSTFEKIVRRYIENAPTVIPASEDGET